MKTQKQVTKFGLPSNFVAGSPVRQVELLAWFSVQFFPNSRSSYKSKLLIDNTQ